MTETTAQDTLARRDPRSMNHMDPETKLVHARLERWGRETRDRMTTGLPAATLLARIIEQGPAGAIQSMATVQHLSEDSAMVDACVGRLWKRGQKAITGYYCTSSPIDAIAKQMGLSLRQLQEVLRRSRWLIGSWLEDMSRVGHIDLNAVSKGCISANVDSLTR